MIGRLWRRPEPDPPEERRPEPDPPAPELPPARTPAPAPYAGVTGAPSPSDGIGIAAVEEQMAALAEALATVGGQVSRFAREQFRANELAERALKEAREASLLARAALEHAARAADPSLSAAPARPAPALPEPVEGGTLKLLQAFMPVLDGIEAALASGSAQLAHVTDPDARTLLGAWLEGQRLLRERLLAVFEREGVRPMDAIGQRFDPFRHVAVDTVFDAARPPGTVIAERRRGYATAGRVLRYAEVVVSTDQAPPPPAAPAPPGAPGAFPARSGLV